MLAAISFERNLVRHIADEIGAQVVKMAPKRADTSLSPRCVSDAEIDAIVDDIVANTSADELSDRTTKLLTSICEE